MEYIVLFSTQPQDVRNKCNEEISDRRYKKNELSVYDILNEMVAMTPLMESMFDVDCIIQWTSDIELNYCVKLYQAFLDDIEVDDSTSEESEESDDCK